jgi:cell shape-determining protein MreC
MRYENQNPQVTYLLEKIEEQEKTIEHLREQLKRVDADLNFVSEKLDERFAQIIDFNVLPWYKKIFYMFKV